MKHIKLKWALETAAYEFDINSRTLSKRLRQSAIEPAFDDDRYSTAQICAAVFGDYQGQRLRKLKAEAESAEMDLAIRKKDYLPTADVKRVWGGVIIAMRQIVKGSSLSDVEKHELLRQVREIDLKEYLSEGEQP